MSATFTKLPLNSSDWTTIYIPDVPNHLTTDPVNNPFGVTCSEVADLIEDKLQIGHISWVEFSNETDHHGKLTGRSARVTFAYWFDTPKAKKVRADIETKGFFLCGGYYSGEKFVQLTDGACISLLASSKQHGLSAASFEMNAIKILTKVKPMVQELATDEMSRETLFWTCQYKLDEHNKRIANILETLDGTLEISETSARILVLEQERDRMRQEYDIALDREIQRNGKLVAARMEQSRKIIELREKLSRNITELREKL